MLGLPWYPAMRCLLQCLFIFPCMNINNSPFALKTCNVRIPADKPPEVSVALTPSLCVQFCSEAARSQTQMLFCSDDVPSLSPSPFRTLEQPGTAVVGCRYGAGLNLINSRGEHAIYRAVPIRLESLEVTGRRPR